MRLLRWCFALGVAGIHVIDIEFDGDHLALPFLHGDDLHARARAFVADYPGLVGGGCVLGDAECLVAMLVSTMRSRIGDAPTPSGELAGCPALTPEARDATLESDAPRGVELDALVERAHALAGPARRLVVTIVTGGYVDFAISWSEGLRRARVEFLVVAQDDTALASLGPRLGRSVIAASSSRNAPGGAGELEAASYGSPEFHAATRRKPEVVRALSLSGLDVLFADADVAFVRDPWPSIIQRQAWPSSGEQTCGVQAQPNHLDEDVAWNLIEFDESARNPTPGRRYFGRSLCSGLVYFAANSDDRAPPSRVLAARACDRTNAAETKLPSRQRRELLPRWLRRLWIMGSALLSGPFRNGMAFKAFGMEQHIASRRSLPPSLAAVHFNYVVGKDENDDGQRVWACGSQTRTRCRCRQNRPSQCSTTARMEQTTMAGASLLLGAHRGRDGLSNDSLFTCLGEAQRTSATCLGEAQRHRPKSRCHVVTSDTSMAAWPNAGAPARTAEFWTSGDYHRCYPCHGWDVSRLRQFYGAALRRLQECFCSVPPALLNDTKGPPIVVFNLGVSNVQILVAGRGRAHRLRAHPDSSPAGASADVISACTSFPQGR